MNKTLISLIAPSFLREYRAMGDYDYIEIEEAWPVRRPIFLTYEYIEYHTSMSPMPPIAKINVSSIVMPHTQMDCSRTLETSLAVSISPQLHGYPKSIVVEGISVREQLDSVRSAQEAGTIDSIITPPYCRLDDKLSIAEASNLPIHIYEIGSIKEIPELIAHPNIASIATSLPLRLASSLRDLHEGPEPDIPLKHIRDSNPTWTMRVLTNFMEMVNNEMYQLSDS